MNKADVSSALRDLTFCWERMIKSNQQINKQVISDCDETECDDSSVQIKLEMVIGESLLVKVLWESFVEEME